MRETDRSEPAILVAGAVELFRGYPAFIQGLNIFMPPTVRIDCTTDPDTDFVTIVTPEETLKIPTLPEHVPLDIKNLVQYFDEIKTQFAHKPHVYESLVDALEDYSTAKYVQSSVGMCINLLIGKQD